MYKVVRGISIAIIFTLCICKNSKAQTYVLIPDANFAAALQNKVPTAMNGNSLNITSTVVTTYTVFMTLSNLNISNLNGIQYFTSLLYLFCDNNSLTSLPALPNSLTALTCNDNSLTSLPALPNSLSYLNCAGNSLTSLPALPNSLGYLSCTGNSLTSLPALPNSLSTLICTSNNIKCFPVIPSSMQIINLNNNPFNCLPNFVLPAMNMYTTTPVCVAGNTNGCSVISVKELSPNTAQLNFYPNPSKGSFSVNIGDEITNGELMIINSIGKVVYTNPVKRGGNHITSGITASGLYQYILLQNKQPFSTGKLIIE